MGAQVQFNYALWTSQFPAFVTAPFNVLEPEAASYFTFAGYFWRNDGTGPVSDPAIQLNLLNLITAHLAQLMAQQNGQPSPTLVGRISQAAEGSVSVQTEYADEVSQSMAFWIQTKYGAMFWQMTAAFRIMRTFPGRKRSFEPWGAGWRGWPGSI